MSTAVATKAPVLDIAKIEQVLIKGDLSVLNEAQRIQYYNQVCQTVGLNPLTKPFEYINLNGKLVLYATKGCAEQLRSLYSISIKITARETIEGVYVVTAAAQGRDGRVDESTGAVQIAGLKGDNLANAMMKAETKAKRRVTLSICGLNMLDETEVETIKETPPKIFADQPGANDGYKGNQPGVYVIPQGSFARKRISEIPEAELRTEVERLEGMPSLEPWQHQFLDRAKEHLTTLENMEPIEVAVERQKPVCICGSGLKLSAQKKVYYCANFKAPGEHIRSIPQAEYEAF